MRFQICENVKEERSMRTWHGLQWQCRRFGRQRAQVGNVLRVSNGGDGEQFAENRRVQNRLGIDRRGSQTPSFAG